MSLTDLAVLVVVVAATAVGGLRWLRVCQREHYLPGRATVIARLWFTRSAEDATGVLVSAALALVALVPFSRAWLAAVLAAALGALVPRGLSVRGRTSALAWTGRLRRLAIGWAVVVLAIGALLWLLIGVRATALVAVTVPFTVDLAAAVMGAVEKRLSAPFVAKAQQRLSRVRPTVVAITGSYGKTSTKGYVAHVLGGARSVVASPASFNNRLGLSRAVNDALVDGTEVFVAEMGTYGPGEIRELCGLFPPDIAAITTIGEAHLERMRSTDVILAAKSEITERARAVVLPVDEPGLAALAERCREQGKRVVTCTVAGADADVRVDLVAATATVPGPDGPVELDLGEGVAHGVNLAIALGIATVLDVDPAALRPRLAALPRAAHRAEVQRTAEGLTVVDDTYNANPVGARAALVESAAIVGDEGRLVLVTPGMVELGPVQRERNAALGTEAAVLGAHVVIVGRTNRAALLEGVRAGGGTYDVVDRREQGVAVATRVAGPKGVILYENDLPDHYP
ncbi:UDP-N-acetylmuramoyl-tripeptide--D-alanyl-D-alanine ligase [Actinotalea sp. M2MS4P-6]|uniref:Mur ligase family protein n=1 Tax=Actinotalea sp. M2MS4P-6 TaxID=2983762 RepID=UPI0021E3ABE6|nr:UDP-N-acetylmuramoyl-tripeptide--D-alanyl-D-alanine ligase [Actinotalea sp. M2MS4P-6]MCV2393993.1 UDP-N-acetylmuramoyl-tripeptide--D-alanyl-D-alanine ligase [Actinotalea sp. M2MS4P-6]